MKFEAELRQFSHTGPPWPFVRYRHFITLLKQSKTEEISNDFASNADQVDIFFETQWRTLEDNIHPSLLYDLSQEPHLTEISGLELCASRQLCFELQGQLNHLISYAHFNTKGFDRILSKTKRLQHKPALNTTILNLPKFIALESVTARLQMLNSFVSSIEEALLNTLAIIPVRSRLIHPLSPEPIQEFFQRVSSHILADNVTDLAQPLEDPLFFITSSALLDLACICQSFHAISMMLSHLDLHREDNLLQSLLARLCSLQRCQTIKTRQTHDLYQLMCLLLGWFSTHMPSTLINFDTFGRLPLHYIVDFGQLSEVEKCMDLMESLTILPLRDLLSQPDFRNETPLHLAVSNGSFNIVRALLKRYDLQQDSPPSEIVRKAFRNAQLLALETGNDFILDLFLGYGVTETAARVDGETFLHVAAQLGCTDKTKLVLNAPGARPLLDKLDSTRRWSPLFFASNEGHKEVVDILVEAGANTDIVDIFNWLASERAAFKGHLDVMEFLLTRQNSSPSTSLKLGKLLHPSVLRTSLDVKAPDMTVLLVRLGSANLRNLMRAVTFHNQLQRYSNLNMELVVGISGQVPGQSFTLDLPLIDTGPNSPLLFQVERLDGLNLTFMLHFPSDRQSSHSGSVIGIGAIALDTLRGGFLLSNHESLVRDHRVTILEPGTTNSVASIIFNLLTVTPFHNVQSEATGLNGFWKDNRGMTVVGHRGLGANKAKKRYLQIGENTIQGFLSATSLGASCIEFDVQLTKDCVPVIYHDFLIKETGTETPIYTLTKQQVWVGDINLTCGNFYAKLNSSRQFTYVGECQDTKTDLSVAAEMKFENGQHSMPHVQLKQRSRSQGAYDDSRMRELVERLKITSHGASKAVKGNRRGFAIQEPLATLEEMLEKLPESIAFDLEMKYPMLWEAEDQNFEPWAMEVNFFVDTILQMIFERAGRRNITFSSFSPEICISLAIKQQVYPILFITKVGNVPVGDERASSIQQATAFANTWNLAGIVTLIKPIENCPRLVQYVQGRGCKYATYGTTSDDPETVQMLHSAGLDAIITNRVRLISETLAYLED